MMILKYQLPAVRKIIARYKRCKRIAFTNKGRSRIDRKISEVLESFDVSSMVHDRIISKKHVKEVLF